MIVSTACVILLVHASGLQALPADLRSDNLPPPTTSAAVMVNPVVDFLRTEGTTVGLASLIDLSSLMNRHEHFLATAWNQTRTVAGLHLLSITP